MTFVQHQGRYLFPALIPIALGMSLGLGTWLLLVERPFSSGTAVPGQSLSAGAGNRVGIVRHFRAVPLYFAPT